MSPEKIVFLIALGVSVLSLIIFAYIKLPKKLKSNKFTKKWRDVQKLCSDKENWREAVIKADNLLDEALKKKKVKGSTMGERLVKAEKKFDKNDDIWFAHKLRGKLESNPDVKLKKDEVKKALLGVGRALKDLGALKK